MRNQCSSYVLQAIKMLPKDIQTYHVIKTARVIYTRDQRGEIGQLSTLFATSIPDSDNALQHQARSFNIANSYLWVAYTLLDHLVDNPTSIRFSHTPSILASIGSLKNRALALYSTSGTHIPLLFELFNEMDDALQIEVSKCRATVTNTTFTVPHLPSHNTLQSLLYKKSLAHIAGPALLNATVKPEAQPHVLEALKKYCAAKQLLDDLHDWEVDLRNGHITLPITKLLLTFDAPEESTHSFETLIPELRRLFWQSVAEGLCATIEQQVSEAILSLQKFLGISPESPFTTATLVPLLRSTQKTIKAIQHQKALLARLRHAQA